MSAPPNALRVTDVGPRQSRIEGDHYAIPEGRWEAEYISFSGFFGKHGPYVFAAAPDLLEALQAVVAMADRATDVFDRARTAIANATTPPKEKSL